MTVSFPSTAVFFHRLSPSGEMPGKVTDRLRFELLVRAHFPFFQWDRRRHTDPRCTSGSFIHASLLGEVASSLRPIPGSFSGVRHLRENGTTHYLVPQSNRSQASQLPVSLPL